MKIFKRAVSVLTAAFAVFTLTVPGALAADKTYARTDGIARGLSLTTEISSISGRRGKSYILDYTPGSGVSPLVAYGDELYGKSDINEIVRYCQNRGYTVMAAVNADFFGTSSGVPTGIVVREGRLCSSDGSWNAVGIRQDGSVICGAPKLDMTFSVNGGQRFPIAAFNKVRDGAGAYLYSSDYGANTHLSAEGPTVVLEKLSGEHMAVGGSLAMRVVSAGLVSGSTPLNDRTMVLTHQKSVNLGIDLTALQPGDLVTVYTGSRSEGWNDVYYACGAGDMMITQSALEEKAMTSSVRGPRTMLGIRDDGSVAILVCDGRGTAAAGMTLREAAMKLYGMGCKNVVNLDGGGSSIASVRYAGNGDVPVISDPSDGRPRQCADYIVFVNTGDRSEGERYVSVYPRDALVLAGGEVELIGRAYNSSYYPTRTFSEGFYIARGAGRIEGNKLVTDPSGGEIEVGAIIDPLESVNATVIAVAVPETMSVVRKGTSTALSKLSVGPGDTVDLDVTVTDGLRTIVSRDEQFTFEVKGDIGTITADGRFTAADLQGKEGEIKVSFGSVSRTVAVTVGKAPTVLRDYDASSNYTVTASGTTTASAIVDTTGDNSRYGRGSLALSFTSPLADKIVYKASTPVSISSGAKELTLMVRGGGAWYIDLTVNGSTSSVPLTGGEGWTMNTVKLPAGATAIEGFSVITSDGESRVMHIDKIIAHYGTSQPDVTPPAVEPVSFDGDLVLKVSDDGAFPLERGNISASVDGAAVTGFTLDQGGMLTVPVPRDGVRHRVSVIVSDVFGNLRRYSADTADSVSGPFGDLADHWAETYVNYLHGKGVFTADETFRPDTGATNEMVATIISRYMGVDTDKYKDVELPYADIALVHDWALPHLKALYSLGIMRGGSDDEGKVWFYPDEPANRARVMTVMGRTVERGYSYPDASYADMAEAPEWSRDHISLLTHIGVVNGYGEDNRVAPGAGITRAEMAAIMYRLY